jgi:hypothetical protein
VRTLSTTALASAFAAETNEVWLILLTISHASLTEPLRFVNNMESVTSRGNLFIAFPFEIEFPGQTADSAGEARISIDNIDRQIVQTLRTIQSPPEVTLEVILASTPSTVEASFSGLILRDATYDVMKVEGTLRFEDIMSEPLSLQMTPQRFPGMF